MLVNKRLYSCFVGFNKRVLGCASVVNLTCAQFEIMSATLFNALARTTLIGWILNTASAHTT
jgi:hypothetical protein